MSAIMRFRNSVMASLPWRENRRASSNRKPLPARLSDGLPQRAENKKLQPHEQGRAIDQARNDDWSTQRRLPRQDPKLSRSDFVQPPIDRRRRTDHFSSW